MTISHPVAYSAREVAALTHVSSQEMAKTVIVKVDRTLVMAVLPASCEIDLTLLREATWAKTISLAKEAEFKDRFAECEIGAMPPFGNLSGMAVYVDETRTKTLPSTPAPTTNCSESRTRISNGSSGRPS